MIKAIILDIGGVVLPFIEPNELHDEKWERVLGLDPGTIATRIWSHENHRRAYTGEISFSEFQTWIGKELGLSGEQLSQWNEDEWALNPFDAQVADWIRSTRQNFKIAFLSNGWSEDRKLLSERYGLDELSDLYVNSAEEGILKPDPRIFEITLERLGVASHEALFVDDLPENVDAALRLGIHSILRQTTDQMIADVEAILSFPDDS